MAIKAEIPGMKKEEISIDFAGDVVTISGEKKSDEGINVGLYGFGAATHIVTLVALWQGR